MELKPSRNEAIVEFSVSDVQPDPLLRKTAADITHEIGTTFRGRVIDNDMPSHHLSPRRIMRLETILDHPGYKDAPRDVKRSVEAATDVHDVELTPEQFEELPRESKNKPIQPKEVRTKKIRTHAGESEVERMVVTFGEVDSG